MYRAYYELYEDYGQQVQTPFVVKIEPVDQCADAVILRAPELLNQEYIITQDPVYYQIPDFVTEPAGCKVTMMHTGLNPNEAIELITFDKVLNKFKFGFSENVSLAGFDSLDYTITVTGMIQDANGNFLSEAIASFVLTVRNPCVMDDFVYIIDKPLPNKVYTLGSMAPDGLTWQHGDFFESYDICGPTRYSAIFLDQVLSATTVPLAYNQETKTFVLYTEDPNLIGIHNLVVEAYFENYPNTLIRSTQTAQIEIISQCMERVSI